MMATKKKSFNAGLDDLLAGLDLPTNDELKRETTGNKISANNQRTWANSAVKEKRKNAIRQSKLDGGAVPKELYHKIYKDSWGPDRRTGYLDKAIKFLSKKGYTISRDKINHVVLNEAGTVTKEEHDQNMKTWTQIYGFGIWEVYSPGVDLLPIYDTHFTRSDLLASVVWDIRFKMKGASPKEIRDFLLPYTGGDYLRSKDGSRVENGRYLNYRNRLFPFLTDKTSKVLRFEDKESLRKWVSKKVGKEITDTYLYQIITNNDGVKEIGELQGYVFRKVL
jgi:hypothetical protein